MTKSNRSTRILGLLPAILLLVGSASAQEAVTVILVDPVSGTMSTAAGVRAVDGTIVVNQDGGGGTTVTTRISPDGDRSSTIRDENGEVVSTQEVSTSPDGGFSVTETRDGSTTTTTQSAPDENGDVVRTVSRDDGETTTTTTQTCNLGTDACGASTTTTTDNDASDDEEGGGAGQGGTGGIDGPEIDFNAPDVPIVVPDCGGDFVVLGGSRGTDGGAMHAAGFPGLAGLAPTGLGVCLLARRRRRSR